MNRDFFTRPRQGTGRSAADYGATKLGPTHKSFWCEYSPEFEPHELPKRGWWIGPMLFGIAIGALGYASFLTSIPELGA